MQRHIVLAFCCFSFATSLAAAQEKLPAGAALQIGVHRLRVTGAIADFAFTPDQRTLVVAYAESDPKKFNVVLFDVATGLERKRLSVRGVRHLAMAVRKPLLALGTNDGVEVWDLAAEKRVHQWKYPDHADKASALTIAPDGTQVIAAVSTLLRWNIETGVALPAFQTRSAKFPIQRLQFSQDGSKLVTVESDSPSNPGSGYFGVLSKSELAMFESELAMFELANWYLLPISNMVGPRTRMLHAAAWTIGSNWVFQPLVPMVTVMDAKTGAKLAEFRNADGDCAVSPDGAMIAYSVNNQYSNRTDIVRLDRERTFVGTVDRTGPVVFSPDSKQLLVDGNFLWDIAGRKAVHEFATSESTTARFSQDGKLIAVLKSANNYQPRGRYMKYRIYEPALNEFPTAAEDNFLQLLEAATGKPKNYATGYAESVGGVAYSPDGRWLASYSGETLFIHDAKTGAEIRRWVAHKSAIRSFAYSPDGKTLASASNDAIALWDSATGKERQRLAFGQNPPRSFAFARDGKTLISVNFEGAVRRWDLADGKHVELGEVPLGREAQSIVMAGDYLACLQMQMDREGNNNLHLKWSRLREKKFLPAAEMTQDIGHGYFDGITFTFSSDGKLLVGSMHTQGDEKAAYAVHVWESATQREIMRFPIDESSTRLLAISPDSRLVAYGASLPQKLQKPQENVPDKGDWSNINRPTPIDGAVVVRDLAQAQGHDTRKTLRPISGHLGPITCLAFSPDGKFLVTGGNDHVVYIWRVEQFLVAPFLAELKADVANYWPSLADANAGEAYRAIAQLERKPKETIALLRKHLKPAVALDEKVVVQQLRDLSSANFGVRQQANHALERAGEDAMPYVRTALQKPANLEAKRRLETLLGKLDRPMEVADHIRAYRCLILLERINTVEARQLLAELAQGTPGAWLTVEARETLRRVTK